MSMLTKESEYPEMLADVISEQERLNDEIKTIDLTDKEGLGKLQDCAWVAGQLKIYRCSVEAVLMRNSGIKPATHDKEVFTSSLGHRSTLK